VQTYILIALPFSILNISSLAEIRYFEVLVKRIVICHVVQKVAMHSFIHSFILRLVRWHCSPLRTVTCFMDFSHSALFFLPLFPILHLLIYLGTQLHFFFNSSFFWLLISSSHQALQLYCIESLYLPGHSTKTSVVRMAITKRCTVCLIIRTFS
jgi:hypothetical protein